jgi:hypothetical protein
VLPGQQWLSLAAMWDYAIFCAYGPLLGGKESVVEKEEYFYPLASLCQDCEEDKLWCGLYTPRRVNEDTLPREACVGFMEKREEEAW